MKKLNRPFLPPFFKKLDNYLLKNKPEIWSARTHLVLYYGGLFMLALGIVCAIKPNDARLDSTVSYWCTFVALLSFIGVVVWLIFLLRFNVFKRFGNVSPSSRLQTFILYFIASGTFVLFPFVPPIVESIRANSEFGDEELVNDVNRLNTLICQLEYDSLPHQWINDTLLVVDSTKRANYLAAHNDSVESGSFGEGSNRVIYPRMLEETLAQKDSTRKLNDSMYVMSTCPDYNFISGSRADHTQTHEFNSIELYSRVIRNYVKPDRASLLAEQKQLTKKYESSDYNHYSYADYESVQYKTPGFEDRNNTSMISGSIRNIAERKYRWDADNRPWQFRLFFYISLILTLLVFIFRHSTTKTFFLTLLTVIILLTLTGLIFAFTSGSEHSLLGWLIFYILMFTGISFFTFQSKTRNIIQGISINIVTFLFWTLPLCATEFYYSSMTDRYGYYDYEATKHSLYTAEQVSLLILILVIPFLVHPFYRRWFALPEQ